jgi:hypothetical protein
MKGSLTEKPKPQGEFKVISARKIFCLLLIGLALGSKTFASEKAEPKAQVNLYLTGAGLALMAGGGTLAYLQNRQANRDMAIYRNSAFTENTTVYRERVREHERWTWVGLAGACLGGLIVVVSF